MLEPILCGPPFSGHPFSRSYGVILPNSLTMLLPSALGFSPHPPVSVYGTGTQQTIAAFLGTDSTRFVTLSSLHITSSDCLADLPTKLLPRLYRSFHSRLMLSTCVPTVLGTHSTGIFTCYPSTTSFDLALGPDLPSADQLYAGNLRYSAGRIPTFLSLLIPAFSLLIPPLLLTGTASSVLRMLLYHSLRSPRLRCCVSAPDIFGAGTLD